MTLQFKPPLQHVCLLRLSAIGDTCHAVAALRALQAAWPQTRFTWIIGKLEAKLMAAVLPEIEFITFDKSATLKELWRLRLSLRGRRFDLLLDMQLSFRASLVSSLIDAPIKLGFDRERARELQWWFTNARIPPAAAEHVLDSFMGFVRACGIEPAKPFWDLTLPPDALEYARGIVSDERPTLAISPCSSHTARNWSAERYAAVADYAAAVRDDVGLVAMIAGIVIDVRMAPGIVSDLLLHIRPLPVLDGLRFVAERLQALLGGWEHAGVKFVGTERGGKPVDVGVSLGHLGPVRLVHHFRQHQRREQRDDGHHDHHFD